jgi:hypothetical protein
MSIEDLVKWESALRNGTLLKKESLKEMWTPLRFNDGREHPYGLGFRLSPIRETRLVAHSGQTAGFGTSISRFVDDDLTVIAITNLGEDGMGTLLALGVAKLYLPKLSLSKIGNGSSENSQGIAVARRAVEERLSNSPSQELFTAQAIRTMNSTRAKARNQRIAAFGPMQSVKFVGTDYSFNFDKVERYLVTTSGRFFLWRLAYDEENKIAEMILEEEERVK